MHALVTGGGGFLGRAVVRHLLARGDRVVSYTRKDYPDLRDMGAETVRGDLADPEAVLKAAEGCEAVFHVGAKAGVWGTYDEYHSSNVIGTENVLAACRKLGIPKLVYTSSPSVAYAEGGVEGIDESHPYPDSYDAPYPETKARAEKMVLAANSPELATTALRPHLIWGPEDPNFLPRLLDRARKGKLTRISGGPYPVDCVYIDNAAHAHLLAADRLEYGAPPAGRAYFITQCQPIDSGELIDRIIGAGGVPPITRTVPPWLALLAGWTVETAYRLVRSKKEPNMTRFLARQLSTPHWFDCSAAKRDLGYEPQISMDEGMRRLAAWIEENDR